MESVTRNEIIMGGVNPIVLSDMQGCWLTLTSTIKCWLDCLLKQLFSSSNYKGAKKL